LERWLQLERPDELGNNRPSKLVRITDVIRTEIEKHSTHEGTTQTLIQGDDEDRPPLVEICVGRDNELGMLTNSPARVIFVTGFGGQGKSTLAAKYFEACRSGGEQFKYFVWRDCKEEQERFENQLASVVESLSFGKISAKDLADQSVESIIDMVTGVLRTVPTLFVFDNADHYVDLDSGKLTGAANVFVEALLRSDLDSRVVFTCRPHVNYDAPEALSCPVRGIDLESTVQLFRKRGASSDLGEIKDAHSLTKGHAFWLDLLAIQVAKRGPSADLGKIVAEIRTGAGPLPLTMLTSIWATLKEREQIVLRAMAETVKSDTEAELGDYLREALNYNKFSQALPTLRSLNLVVVKPRQGAPDALELHPLVRHFVRSSFPPQERLSYIHAINKAYRRFISKYKFQLSQPTRLSVLQYWTQSAELDIAAGRFDDAFNTLAEVAEAFSASAYAREFCRAARLLFANIDWVADHARFNSFENVFQTHIDTLANLGEDDEVDVLLERYEATLPNRDARYIGYCEMRCHANWTRQNYTAAIRWGKIGKELLMSSGVDTAPRILHSLALAERDSGHPELALPFFLGAQALSEATNPDELDEVRGGAHYGNIGRCLHMMGQIDAALICYQKSAILIQKDTLHQRVLNQAFIRFWVGELLAAKGERKLAHTLLKAAYLKWRHISPTRAAQAMALAQQVQSGHNEPMETIEDRKVEGVVLDWILSRQPQLA
jgi:tetratricopeptide (TPR) repeat protein